MKWSHNSNLLAAEEWLNTDYQNGPITRVALFDVDKNKVSFFRTVYRGFVGDFSFEENKLIYKKDYHASGRIEETEVDLDKISNWEDF
jgi:hypothetical protein